MINLVQASEPDEQVCMFVTFIWEESVIKIFSLSLTDLWVIVISLSPCKWSRHTHRAQQIAFIPQFRRLLSDWKNTDGNASPLNSGVPLWKFTELYLVSVFLFSPSSCGCAARVSMESTHSEHAASWADWTFCNVALSDCLSDKNFDTGRAGSLVLKETWLWER